MKKIEMKTLSEESRARLIGQIATVLRTDTIPSEAREAGLTLIGWLARRMPGDETPAHGMRAEGRKRAM